VTTPTISIHSEGGHFPLVARNLAELRQRISGRLVTAADEDFDTARQTPSLNYDRKPLALVRVANVFDVVEALRFARYHDYPLAVRSGGHSIPGYGVMDGAVVIDFAEYRKVEIDPVARKARVQTGATSADLAIPANAHGLALSTGDTSTVGIGGLTTGGGVGYLVRKYGLAIDNLLSAQVVTADGSVITASAEENEDLFWAIRGGGGNFGIVTEFEFRLAPVGDIYGGALFLPLTREVLRGYLDYIVRAPEDLTTISHVMHAPPAPFIPEDRVGEPVLQILTTWTGDMDEADQAIAPLRALAEPVSDCLGRIPYPEMYEWMRPAEQRHGAVVRQMFADSLSDGFIDTVIARFEEAPGPFTMVQLRGVGGGAMGRVPANATAFAHRDANYFVAILALWFDPLEDPTPHRAWAEDLWAKIRPEGRGVYVNFLAAEGEGRIREAYPNGTYERLAEVKRKYDPANVFRFNQNIRPSN
jgi:FAD/FMN-containing dehydrogenase